MSKMSLVLRKATARRPQWNLSLKLILNKSKIPHFDGGHIQQQSAQQHRSTTVHDRLRSQWETAENRKQWRQKKGDGDKRILEEPRAIAPVSNRSPIATGILRKKHANLAVMQGSMSTSLHFHPEMMISQQDKNHLSIPQLGTQHRCTPTDYWRQAQICSSLRLRTHPHPVPSTLFLTTNL